MKSLIVTVAGKATRFNRDTETETLKCLYTKGDFRDTLLYRLLEASRSFDEMVIVGGFLYEKLENFIYTELKEFQDKITLVYNPHYEDYGSGYSLLKGLESVSPNAREVLFAEGDLYVDPGSYAKVVKAEGDVITVNREPIYANKAVVFYIDRERKIHYLYDTAHTELFIGEPFSSIFNSGQIWKFGNVNRLQQVAANLTEKQLRGTNLEIIQGYFGDLKADTLQILCFEKWHNCNTVADYDRVYGELKELR
ncbi:MAG: NTP transferase domain-containing protein [Bacteroides sp.]|nr:NTP transferase domain-containing protein [Bacteroides sp.]